MGHNTLMNYYKSIYNMNKYHNFSPDVIENMIPFERDLYQEMIVNEIEQEEADLKKKHGVDHPFG